MGLISALIGSAGGVLADQWKEFFYCEAMPFDVLMKKGEKVVGGRSSNTKGSDNIISNGSKIAVADGQCMIIVEQGKIVEVCAEPGEFIYDTSSEPSIFYGGLGKGILNTFKQIGKRFTFGGDTGKDQRVYYFNTKELMDNKFGTNNPIPFRVCDKRVNLDVDVDLRCNGVYSYRIADPLLFYTNVCANVPYEFKRSEIDTQLKTEFVSALQPALAKLSLLQMRPSEIPAHAEELSDAMNEALSKKWGEMRGLVVVNVAMNPITLTPEDAAMIKSAQKAAMYTDPTIAIASRVEATNTAMVDAANNANGAVAGLAGVGMIGGMNGGSDLNALSNMPRPTAPAATWICAKCGQAVDEKFGFCPFCGEKKPAPVGTWTCTNCGNAVDGKFAFCPNCGNKKPAAAAAPVCANCGSPAPDPANPPKFCPNCGKPFAG